MSGLAEKIHRRQHIGRVIAQSRTRQRADRDARLGGHKVITTVRLVLVQIDG